MMATIKAKALSAGVIVLLVVAAWLYWQHVTDQLDAYKAEAERQRTRADTLQEHQQWQRQQIATLNAALVKRDQTLQQIAADMSASRTALEQLGEADAQAAEWMDSPLPGGIAEWVRQLQAGGADADGSVPDSARAPDQPGGSAAADLEGQ